MRVVSFEWRTKSESPRWRRVWLWANAVGSFGASLVWGVGLANLLYGVPINSSGDFTGSFWDLFNAYTLLGGVAVVLPVRLPRRDLPDAAHEGRSVRASRPRRAPAVAIPAAVVTGCS